MSYYKVTIVFTWGTRCFWGTVYARCVVDAAEQVQRACQPHGINGLSHFDVEAV